MLNVLDEVRRAEPGQPEGKSRAFAALALPDEGIRAVEDRKCFFADPLADSQKWWLAASCSRWVGEHVLTDRVRMMQHHGQDGVAQLSW